MPFYIWNYLLLNFFILLYETVATKPKTINAPPTTNISSCPVAGIVVDVVFVLILGGDFNMGNKKSIFSQIRTGYSYLTSSGLDKTQPFRLKALQQLEDFVYSGSYTKYRNKSLFLDLHQTGTEICAMYNESWNVKIIIDC